MSDDALLDLHRRFRLRCGQDLVALRAARQSLDGLASHAFRVMVHQLSGAAGSFGYGELSRVAAVIDEDLLQENPPRDIDLDRLQTALETMAVDHGS